MPLPHHSLVRCGGPHPCSLCWWCPEGAALATSWRRRPCHSWRCHPYSRRAPSFSNSPLYIHGGYVLPGTRIDRRFFRSSRWSVNRPFFFVICISRQGQTPIYAEISRVYCMFYNVCSMYVLCVCSMIVCSPFLPISPVLPVSFYVLSLKGRGYRFAIVSRTLI